MRLSAGGTTLAGDPLQRIGEAPGAIAERFASNYQPTFRTLPEGFHLHPDVVNKAGAPLAKPRRGARGIAGMRADLRDKRITLTELQQLRPYQLVERYRVSYSHARFLRRRLLEYGPHGPTRRCPGFD